MPPTWILVLAWTAVAHTAGRKANLPEDIVERITSHGLTVKEDELQTEDGYILTLFRFRRPGKTIGRPVVLMHGLLQNAAIWLDSPAGLGYLLPEAGRDLWIGNARGTRFSRRHVKLDPDKDPQFWDFSIDEIGFYDLPAVVDRVLSQTGSKKLDYIGFSQGGCTFFAMCSERPEYCGKVSLLIALAPSSRHIYTKSIVFRSLVQYANIYEDLIKAQGVWEVAPVGGFVNKFIRYFCSASPRSLRICISFKDALDGRHPGSISSAALKMAVGNFPGGTSVHNLAKYGQALTCKKFLKFDYGTKRNLKRYGSEYPPVYNLSAVTVPTVVIYGRNDGIVDIRDVKWLLGQLPDVVEAFEVNHPSWTHLDMNLSKDVPRLLYPKIMEYLDKFS